MPGAAALCGTMPLRCVGAGQPPGRHRRGQGDIDRAAGWGRRSSSTLGTSGRVWGAAAWRTIHMRHTSRPCARVRFKPVLGGHPWADGEAPVCTSSAVAAGGRAMAPSVHASRPDASSTSFFLDGGARSDSHRDLDRSMSSMTSPCGTSSHRQVGPMAWILFLGFSLTACRCTLFPPSYAIRRWP